METSALNKVKQLIESASTQQTHLIFLDRDGEIDRVSEDTRDEDTWVRLQEEASARSGAPCCGIVSIAPGPCFFCGPDKHLGEISDGALLAAIDFAVSERQRFFDEKAEAEK